MREVPPSNILSRCVPHVMTRWSVMGLLVGCVMIVGSNMFIRDYVWYEKNDGIAIGRQETTLDYMKEHRKHLHDVPKLSVGDAICPLDYVKERVIRKHLHDAALWNTLVRQFIPTKEAEPDTSRLRVTNGTNNYTSMDIPRSFNNSFHNPCWHNPAGLLVCLPYVYLAGFPKCGTTDLYSKLVKHPQIHAGNVKEPHWWTRKRRQGVPLDVYLSVYSKASRCFNSIAELNLPGPVPVVSVDGSASTFWDNRAVVSLNDTDGTLGPLFTDELAEYQPEAKFIVIVRDPVHRLASGYTYFWRPDKNNTPTSPADFHEKVTEAISLVQGCMKNHSVRVCTYTSEITTKVRLRVGMYSVYLRDWLRRYPSRQIHFLRTEDYSLNRTKELSDIFQFLNLDPMSDSIFAKLDNQPTRNSQKHKLTMWPKTDKLLRDFYKPYNEDLAKLLNNSAFTWDHGTS